MLWVLKRTDMRRYWHIHMYIDETIYDNNAKHSFFLPSTLKKLRGQIALSLSTHLSILHPFTSHIRMCDLILVLLNQDNAYNWNHARIQGFLPRGGGGSRPNCQKTALTTNFFQGGWGVQMLISTKTHITCDFLGVGGGSGPPIPPLELHMRMLPVNRIKIGKKCSI